MRLTTDQEKLILDYITTSDDHASDEIKLANIEKEAKGLAENITSKLHAKVTKRQKVEESLKSSLDILSALPAVFKIGSKHYIVTVASGIPAIDVKEVKTTNL